MFVREGEQAERLETCPVKLCTMQMPDPCGQEGGCRAGWVTSADHFLWSGEGFPAVKWGAGVSILGQLPNKDSGAILKYKKL